MKFNWTYGLFILVFFSCKKIIDKPIKYESNSSPVIQATITSDTSYQEIYITELMDNEVDVLTGKSNANVYIYTPIRNLTGDTLGYDTTYFSEDPGQNGLYITNSFNFKYVDYFLEVIIENDTFKAQDKAPAFNRADSLVDYHTFISYIDHDTSLNNYKLTQIISTIGKPLLYKIKLDWSEVEGYENLPYEENHAEVSGYQFRSMDAHQLLGAHLFWLKDIIFPSGTKFSIENYSTSAEHIYYLRGIANETMWKGGFLDIQSANPRTNLSNGAFGFFAVSDRIIESGIIQ